MGVVKLKHVPVLRFPEFGEPWQTKRGRELFGNRRLRGEDGLPLYSVTLNNGLVPRDSLDRQFGGDAETESHLRAKPGDLVYNMMRMWQGAVGRADVECMVSPAYVVLMPAKDVDSKYFVYQLQKARALYDLWAYSYGLTDDRLRLYYRDFGHVKFHVPKQPEQKKIAGSLAVVEKKIEALRRQRELLQTYKRGMMRKIFSRELRFKADDGSEFPEWRKKRLGDYLVEHSQRVSADTDLPIYSSSREGLKLQKDYFDNREVINEGEYGIVPYGFFTYRHMSDDITFKFNINFIAEKIAVSKEYPVFKTDRMNSIFLLNLLNNSIEFKRFAATQKLGGTRTRLYYKNLSGWRTLIPVIAEQQKIADFLSAIDAKIDAVSLQIEKMETFKMGLLQQLFV